MRHWILSGVLIASGLFSGLEAWGLEFTADQIVKVGRKTQKANLYYRDDRWRLEHQSMGPVNVTIVRKDKQVMWLLLSRVRHFKTLPYDPAQEPKLSEHLEGEVSREEIGRETREDHPTILYEVTVKEGDQTDVYYQWFATDIQFPMQLTRKDGSWSVEYRHVRLRPVTDYLFQLPLNFQPLEEFDPPKKEES
ncbi:hypothetical protein PJI16_19520 [Nitrospira sp. MA-1]|nr:hypothetical protein [Nitrospira sp. MA-1]